MNNKERVIDLRQFFIYVWQNFVLVVLIGALSAGGLAFLGYKKQKDNLSRITSIHTIMNQNRESYFNSMKNYTDAHKPENTVESRAKLYLDYNIDGFDEGGKVDNNNIMTHLAYDAGSLCVSESALQNVIDKLDLRSYDDMKNITPYDLSWMVNKNVQGAHVMIIVVTDVNAKRAHDIAEAVTEEFVKNSKELGLVDNIQVIDEASVPDELIIGKGSINIKSIIKYFIVGGAAGVLFILVVLLLIFIIRDNVRTADDIEFAGLKKFADISLKQKRFAQDMKRLAVSIEGSDTGKIVVLAPVDKYSFSDKMVDSIEEAFKSLGLKAGVLSGDLSETIVSKDKLSKAVADNDYLIVVPDDMKNSADALIAARGGNDVILLTRYGKSRVNTLIKAGEEMAKVNAKIQGTVIVR